MTVLTTAVVATVVTTGAAIAVTAPAAASIAPGAAYGLAAVTGSVSTASAAVAGSAGVGASVGAITGAVAGGTAGAAATGAAVGSASAAAVTSSSFGAATLVAGGPVSWLILGVEQDARSPVNATFDCWKPVLRDKSTEPSRGKLLKEIFEDQRIKQVIVQESRNTFNLPELSLVNTWGDQFELNYLVLPTNNQLVAHAVRVA